jgi:hypothetical protein
MASADGLDALSVSELRALLTGANVNFKDCVEKARLHSAARCSAAWPGARRSFLTPRCRLLACRRTSFAGRAPRA